MDTGRTPSVLAQWGALVLVTQDPSWLAAELSALLPWMHRVVVVDARGSDADPAAIEAELARLNDAGSLGRTAPRVMLAEQHGSDAASLNRALGQLGTPLALVVEERDFFLDLPEVLLCMERLPRAASLMVKRTSFVGGPDHQVTPEDEVLITCRPERGFTFTGFRKGTLDHHDRIDVQVLSYARLEEDRMASADLADHKRYTNRHPVAAARQLGLAPAAPSPADRAPKVSIIVPFYGAQDVTRDCVLAILDAAETEDCPSFEVILRDDAGPGGHAGLEDVLADERVRLSSASTNLGFLLTCNAAAAEARGAYLVFLNNDTQPLPGWLEALVQVAEEDPRAGVVGSMLLYPDGIVQEAGGIVFSDASGWNYGKRDKAYHDRYHYRREVDYCSGASILVRRELWEAAGGFDERFAPAYYEDTDLCMQARERGYSVVYQPRSRVIHLEGYSSGTDVTEGVKQHQEINKTHFFEKWRSVLERDHKPSGSNPHVARERTPGKHVMVANPSFPYFDRDSGSFRLLQILSALRDLGQRVTFIAHTWPGNCSHRKRLEELGIETRTGRLHSDRKLSNGVTLQVVAKDLVAETPIDLALLYHFSTARKFVRYLRRHSPLTRAITDTVDVHFLRLERRAEVTGDPAIAKEAKRTKQRELATYRSSDLVVAISDDEAEFLRPYLPKTPVTVIPNVHPIPSRKVGPESRQDLLFIGSFAHPPNGDALEYLVRQIMPLVWEQRPDQVLTVVGGGKDSRIEGLASERVRFLGYVDDLDPILFGSRMLVAPLRFGAGAKGKVGQALSYGLPIVTTTVGSEGLGMTDGHDYLLAQTPEEFSSAILRLCDDDALWTRLATNGVDRIRDGFSYEAVRDMIRDRLLSLDPHSPSLGREWKRLLAFMT